MKSRFEQQQQQMEKMEKMETQRQTDASKRYASLESSSLRQDLEQIITKNSQATVESFRTKASARPPSYRDSNYASATAQASA